MQTVRRSLEEISTMFSIFEKDQVLTHDQLNSLSAYLEDQDRLSRIYLTGVGLVAGLRPVLQGQQVRVSKGFGLTTDGDLLMLADDTLYDRFRLYGENAPSYPPFGTGTDMIPIFELVRVGESVVDSKPLNQFAAVAGSAIQNFALVHYMESYVKDDDLCSGTDCDNLGQEAVNIARLLLIEKSFAADLQATMFTADKAFDTLSSISIPRVNLSSTITTSSQFAQSYRTASNTLHTRILAALDTLMNSCKNVFIEELATDPVPSLKAALTTQNQSFSTRDIGIQYYFSGLSDIARVWNEFRESLVGIQTILCPDLDAFPKHILLGMVKSTNEAEFRTPFFPSPANVSQQAFERARFLLKKILLMIPQFEVPTTLNTVRITPNQWRPSTMDVKAVPHYFKATGLQAIYRQWNFHLAQKNRGLENYGYHAESLGATGAAANPLAFDIEPYNHFRIEGHIGKPAAATYNQIKQLVASQNLPFAVQAVMLTTNTSDLVIKPKYQFTDLHRFHQVLRHDLVNQMDEVDQFSAGFKGGVLSAVNDRIVVDSPTSTEGIKLKDTAESMHTKINDGAKKLKTALNKPYKDFAQEGAWRSDLNKTMSVAGEFKYELGYVVKTEFATPFDGLISSTHLPWIDWIDILIKDKDDKRAKKATFPGFLKRHSGLAHESGVPRGGTFVVVHDTSGTIVGDLCLPYWLDEDEDDDVDEPTLPKPTFKPPLIIDKGIKLQPPRTKMVKDWFKVDIEPDWNGKLTAHVGYFDVFKNSISTMGDVFSNLEKRQIDIKGVKPQLNDSYLDMLLREQDLKVDKVNLLKEQLINVELPQDKRLTLEEDIKKTELNRVRMVKKPCW